MSHEVPCSGCGELTTQALDPERKTDIGTLGVLVFCAACQCQEAVIQRAENESANERTKFTPGNDEPVKFVEAPATAFADVPTAVADIEAKVFSLEPEPIESRSVQRRKAAQRGEPAPEFDAPTVADAPKAKRMRAKKVPTGERKAAPETKPKPACVVCGEPAVVQRSAPGEPFVQLCEACYVAEPPQDDDIEPEPAPEVQTEPPSDAPPATDPEPEPAPSADAPPLDYAAFIARKSQLDDGGGFAPTWMPDQLFDFQRALVEWAQRKGRGALFADTGMGKTAMQLTWGQNVVRHTNKPVLVLTPLAVAPQTVHEAGKFGIECARITDGIHGAGIYVTNYERLHHLDCNDFAGVICDESSILKSASGETRRAVTRFMSKVPYRLLATATASPNDYIELGTSSEALGSLGYTDMLSRFFKQSDRKGSRIEDVKASRADREIELGLAMDRDAGGNHFGKLSFRVSQQIGQWRMKGHAVVPFWRWVASWARACRKPSDVGPYDDSTFVLPPLIEHDHVVEPKRPADGMLFTIPAFGLQEERDERRRTLNERCEFAARLVAHDKPAIVWCHMNLEGDLLEKIIPGCVQIKGANTDEEKEERFAAFLSGESRVLVIKPKIGAFGLNFQHCAHVVSFATHSHEQDYQAVRRCWRFGQKSPVVVDRISTTGEVHVRASLARKQRQADEMFTELVKYMHESTRVDRTSRAASRIEVPSWL